MKRALILLTLLLALPAFGQETYDTLTLMSEEGNEPGVGNPCPCELRSTVVIMESGRHYFCDRSTAPSCTWQLQPGTANLCGVSGDVLLSSGTGASTCDNWFNEQISTSKVRVFNAKHQGALNVQGAVANPIDDQCLLMWVSVDNVGGGCGDGMDTGYNITQPFTDYTGNYTVTPHQSSSTNGWPEMVCGPCCGTNACTTDWIPDSYCATEDCHDFVRATIPRYIQTEPKEYFTISPQINVTSATGAIAVMWVGQNQDEGTGGGTFTTGGSVVGGTCAADPSGWNCDEYISPWENSMNQIGCDPVIFPGGCNQACSRAMFCGGLCVNDATGCTQAYPQGGHFGGCLYGDGYARAVDLDCQDNQTGQGPGDFYTATFVVELEGDQAQGGLPDSQDLVVARINGTDALTGNEPYNSPCNDSQAGGETWDVDSILMGGNKSLELLVFNCDISDRAQAYENYFSAKYGIPYGWTAWDYNGGGLDSGDPGSTVNPLVIEDVDAVWKRAWFDWDGRLVINKNNTETTVEQLRLQYDPEHYCVHAIDAVGNYVIDCPNGGSVTIDGVTIQAEINNLETITTGIAADEIVVGTGADTAAYKKISDLDTEAAPDTGDWFLCEDELGNLNKCDAGDIAGPVCGEDEIPMESAGGGLECQTTLRFVGDSVLTVGDGVADTQRQIHFDNGSWDHYVLANANDEMRLAGAQEVLVQPVTQPDTLDHTLKVDSKGTINNPTELQLCESLAVGDCATIDVDDSGNVVVATSGDTIELAENVTVAGLIDSAADTITIQPVESVVIQADTDAIDASDIVLTVDGNDDVDHAVELRLAADLAAGEYCDVNQDEDDMSFDCVGTNGVIYFEDEVLFNDTVNFAGTLVDQACGTDFSLVRIDDNNFYECIPLLTFNDNVLTQTDESVSTWSYVRYMDSISGVEAVYHYAEDTATNQHIDQVWAGDGNMKVQTCCTGAPSASCPVPSADCELSAYSLDVIGGGGITTEGNSYIDGDLTVTGALICDTCPITATSQAAATNTAFTFNASTARTTGDLFEIQDATTWKFRWNAAGHGQFADNGRLFLANGSDESVYNDTWGLIVGDDAITGTSSTTEPVFRLRSKNQQSTGGNSTNRGFQVASEFAPTGNSVTGASTEGAYIQAATNDTGTGHTLSSLIGLYNLASANGSGTTTITSLEGERLLMQFGGTNKTISTATGIVVKTPTAPGTGTTVTTLNGMQIENLGGHGTYTAAISVSAQTTDSANEGNISMSGGDYDDGHLQLGSTHVWSDSSNDFRVNAGGTPSSSTDGECVAGCTDSTVTRVFGVSSTATLDTGDEACAQVGLTCSKTYDMTGTTQNCTYDWYTVSTLDFEAWCY